MKVTSFNQGEPRTFTTLLCDGYRVEDPGSMGALVAFLRETASRHPDAHLFATLDKFGQASYTSGHATDTHALDDTEGHDLSSVDPAAFENGEHPGYLSTKSEFFIRYSNLIQKVANTTFDDIRGKLHWGYDGFDFDFFELNAKADEILDKEVYVQIVPVRHAYETICAFPNGYFHDDLTPMEVFTMAKHFEEKYGARLFGIGASYVGFLQPAAMTDDTADAFATDLLSIFRGQRDVADQARTARLLQKQPFVLFTYTGS